LDINKKLISLFESLGYDWVDEQLEMDSLDFIKAIVLIEDTFNIIIPDAFLADRSLTRSALHSLIISLLDEKSSKSTN